MLSLHWRNPPTEPGGGLLEVVEPELMEVEALVYNQGDGTWSYEVFDIIEPGLLLYGSQFATAVDACRTCEHDMRCTNLLSDVAPGGGSLEFR